MFREQLGHLMETESSANRRHPNSDALIDRTSAQTPAPTTPFLPHTKRSTAAVNGDTEQLTA